MKPKQPKEKYPVVMLIDDNEIDNFINERMIKGCSFADKIYVNTGAKSALEFLKNVASMDSKNELFPDIVFLDINMPLMDGFMFIEEFNKMKLSDKDTKIILLTSSVSPEDENKSTEYPIVRKFVRKPLTESTLASL